MSVMTARPEAYIYPPRSKSVIPRGDTQLFADLGWQAQYKFNDSHLLLKLKPDAIEFWARHGDRMAYGCPDWVLQQVRTAQDVLGLDRQQYHLLDGGMLDSRHPAIKDTIVIWDILVRDGEHLVGATYGDRYTSLSSRTDGQSWLYTHPSHGPVDFGLRLTDNIFIPRNHQASAWNDVWATVDLVNQPYTKAGKTSPVLEGLVLKDLDGRLEHGFRENNNGHFMVRSRIETNRHRF